EISRWLEQDWFAAIERCQELLDATAQTLRQLSELLLSYTHQFQTVLQDLLELAAAAEQDIAEAVVHRTMGQIDRIAVWGSARQAAWSEYYDHAHRYLREVVRLDPARALTARLREQLSGHALAPFSLLVADAQPLWVLRSVLPPAPAAPVRRPRGPRSEKLEERPAEPVPDALETRVQELLGQGSLGLSELTARATADLPEQDHFADAGKVAELAARWAEPQLARERPWVTVREGLVIEDWHIDTARIEALHAEPLGSVARDTAAGSELPSPADSTVLADGSPSQFVEVEA
ncbi:MAG TPA: hypothetical protein VG963_13640, partial [Polyangiaceae bacterium]|nr:hypothetical protein [Polyangiaceae bacterium]